MGTLFWITGLSGAGKTTVAVELNRIVKEKGKIAIFLDGDILREVFAEGHSYTQEDRLKLASQYARLQTMKRPRQSAADRASSVSWNRCGATGASSGTSAAAAAGAAAAAAAMARCVASFTYSP